MDGETALKYIRTRHSPQGDFDRLERQQQVLEALKQKIASLHPVWDLPDLLKIADELYKKISTNFPLTEMPQFWQLAKQISPEDIKNITVEKENNLVTTESIPLGNEMVSIVKPKAGLEDYSQIQRFIEENK